MTRASTASSSTDAAAAAPGAAGRVAAEREAAERATRRQFFRLFGRQTVTGAGNVLAGVAALRATGRDALDELLAAGSPGTRPPGQRVIDDEPLPLPAVDALRSPYRVEGTDLHVLDQRQLPDRVETLRLGDASEVASAIRMGVLGAGPVLGQVAAYSIALAAEAAAGRGSYWASAALGQAADTLRAARPTSRAMTAAIERVLVAPDARAEADLIAMEAALDHARIGQHAASVLVGGAPAEPPARRPLALLFIGDLGPLSGGMVGPGFALCQALSALGWPVHAWLAEGAPLHEGRTAAWQLAQLGVAHTLVPDAGTGWLLEHRHIDAVLLRAEWVAASGDALVPLGSAAVARVARERGVAVYAVAPSGLLDPSMPDGSALPADVRQAAAARGDRLDPAADVLDAALLDGVMTDEGLLTAPFSRSIAAALETGAARRTTDNATPVSD